MLSLQERACHNVNFVTAEHVVPRVIEAIAEMHRRVGPLRFGSDGSHGGKPLLH